MVAQAAAELAGIAGQPGAPLRTRAGRSLSRAARRSAGAALTRAGDRRRAGGA
jgi:hypothetical protein